MVKYAAKGNIINFQNKSGRSDKNRGAFVLILKHGGSMLKHTATKMGIKKNGFKYQVNVDMPFLEMAPAQKALSGGAGISPL